MREIKVKVSFEKCAIQKDSLRIVSGDYNSTKLVFEFDREDGIKILEMNDPEDNLLYNGVIENNEVVLVRKDEDDNPCSLFAEEGTYPFEVVLYDGESKLTAVGGKLKITAETVAISDTIVTPQLPVFDQLLGQVSTALNNCEEAVEDIYNAEEEAQGIISNFESNVGNYTAAFNANASSKTQDFNTNASTKTQAVNQIYEDTQDLVDGFDTKVTQAKNELNGIVSDAQEVYDDFETNAAAKTTAFNDNAVSKTETFNTNASEKTSAFNTNAAAKTSYFDSHADSIEKELASLKTTRNAIPKITGEGTEVTLDKTAEATFEKVGLMGNCEQETSPNPDYPQDIHVVSGDNVVKVENKNLYGNAIKTANTGTSANTIVTDTSDELKINGVEGYYSGIYKKYQLVPNTTYTLSLRNSNKGTNSFSRVVYKIGDECETITNSNSDGGTNVEATTTSISFTTNNTGLVAIMFTCNWATNTGSVTYNDIMLNEGSTASTYEPHKEQIKHITLPNSMELAGIGDYKDEIRRSTGKNLFSSTWENGTISASGVESSSTNRIRTKDLIPVKPSTTYTLNIFNSNMNLHLFYYQANEAFVERATSDWTRTKYTFTTPSNVEYIKVIASYVSGADLTPSNLEMYQLEEGSSATDYEPYGVGVWYKYSAIGKVVLDGTETWMLNNTFDEVTQFNVPLLLTPNSDSMGLSTHFIVRNDWNNNQHIKLNNVNSKAYLYIDNNIATDINTLKQWLSNNPVTVYYLLATPTYETITDTTLISQLDDIYYTMKSYKGQTNITQTPNDAPFYLDVEALYDLEDLLTRVSALEG